MSDQEEKAAQALADWIDAGGKGSPPEGVDPDVIGAAFVLNRDLVPDFNPSFDAVRARVQAQRVPQAANNNRWFGIILGVVVGAAAALLLVPMGTSDEPTELTQQQTVSDNVDPKSPFETVADKVDPMKPFTEPDLPSDGFKSPITEDEAGGVQVGEAFDSAGWQVDGTIAKRATVYCGSAAIQRVRFAEGKVESNELMFSFVAPKGTTDPLAAGQSITPNPQKAAEDLQSVLDAQFSLSGFGPTKTAMDDGQDAQTLYCRKGKGRLVKTNAASDTRVELVLSEPAAGCVE